MRLDSDPPFQYKENLPHMNKVKIINTGGEGE